MGATLGVLLSDGISDIYELTWSSGKIQWSLPHDLDCDLFLLFTDISLVSFQACASEVFIDSPVFGLDLDLVNLTPQIRSPAYSGSPIWFPECFYLNLGLRLDLSIKIKPFIISWRS